MSDAEVLLRERCEAGDFEGACTLAIRTYGPEVLAFLCHVRRGEDAASEVFSATCEDLWKGLPTFEWRCSFRTWVYTLARNAAYRDQREKKRSARVLVPLTPDRMADVAHQVRTETFTWLRTESRSKLQELRDSLSEEERMLLALRVDRKLSWNDVARVVTGDTLLSEEDAAQAARAIRKRFQRLKSRLKSLAREHGLLGDTES